VNDHASIVEDGLKPLGRVVLVQKAPDLLLFDVVEDQHSAANSTACRNISGVLDCAVVRSRFAQSAYRRHMYAIIAEAGLG
jgi:hypothetical protein